MRKVGDSFNFAFIIWETETTVYRVEFFLGIVRNAYAIFPFFQTYRWTTSFTELLRNLYHHRGFIQGHPKYLETCRLAKIPKIYSKHLISYCQIWQCEIITMNLPDRTIYGALRKFPNTKWTECYLHNVFDFWFESRGQDNILIYCKLLF